MAIVRATGTLTGGDLSFFTAVTINGVNVLNDITLEAPNRWQLEFDNDGLPDPFVLSMTGGGITRTRTYPNAVDTIAGTVTGTINSAPANTPNYISEITAHTGDTFSARLTLESGVPAQLWYRIVGEPSFTRRIPSETTSRYSTHNQTAPGTEGKSIASEEAIEYYWRFGADLEFQTMTGVVEKGAVIRSGQAAGDASIQTVAASGGYSGSTSPASIQSATASGGYQGTS